MNRHIDEQYRQMLIQVKTTEMANADLDKYYHALDKYALSSFPLAHDLQGIDEVSLCKDGGDQQDYP
jgi:hypothetical protein